LARRDNYIYPLGGRFFLDITGGIAEINGWGGVGPVDDSNNQDLGNTSAYPNLSRTAGGLMFPEDMRLIRMYASHYDNNANALRWGWVITRLQKAATTTVGSNAQAEIPVYSEIGAYRDYTTNQNQLTQLEPADFTNNVIPAGEVLNLATAVDETETVDTNRYVQVMAGFMEFEYVTGASEIR